VLRRAQLDPRPVIPILGEIRLHRAATGLRSTLWQSTGRLTRAAVFAIAGCMRAALESIQTKIGRRMWIALAACLVISTTASPLMAQSCCLCDCGAGGGSSCNTGLSNQAECEALCADFAHCPFGGFQTCPPGMVLVRCSPPDSGPFCDAVCAVPVPTPASVPATSTTGTLIAIAILVGLGAFVLRRRGQLPH
jgi:hypothetical protein